MAIAFDAASNSGVQATGTLSWTHTPVGTPRGVVVLITSASGTAGGKVISVTYGGIPMADVSGSPNIHTTGELGSVYSFFLGAHIPTGAKTVVVTTASQAHTADCVSLTASTDTDIQDIDISINSDSTANPSGLLTLGGNSCFCALAFVSGQNATTGVTENAGWTARNEEDLGTVVRGCYTYDTIGTADVQAKWTQTAEDAVMFAIAIKEASAPAPAVYPVQVMAKVRGTAQTALAGSFATLPTVGNLLLVHVQGWRASNFDVTSVTDNQTGNTWARALQGPLAGGARGEVWWCKVVGSSGTFTVTANTASSTVVMSGQEVTGFTTPVVDVSATNTEAAADTSPTTTATATTTAAVEYLVAMTVADTGGAYVFTRALAGSNPLQGWYSVLDETDSNTYQAGDFVSAVVPVTGAMVHNWAVTGAGGWVSGLVTFKEGAVAAVYPPQSAIMVRQAVKRAANW